MTDPNSLGKPLSAADEPTFITGNNAGDATVETVQGKLANYKVLSEIARGGMGVVYRARQISADRIVALKVVRGHDPNPAEIERFLTEARAAARLDHAHIVPVYEVGEVAGEPYFSMRLIDGPSLSQQLSGQPLPCRDAASLVKTIAAAIQYAHDRGIIHRDLKPGNILMDSAGQPHVTDFGLARMIDGASELTQSGQVVGTPSYMPPEQALGQREKVDERSDVYSIGAVLYSCLTGRPPFRAASATATIMQLLSREVVAPRRLNSEIDADLETICLKCLQKEPRQRYATAGELANDLQRYLEHKPILARPTSRSERLFKWAKRNPTVAGLSGIAVVAVLTLLIGGAVYQLRLTDALRETQQAEAERTATLYDSLVQQADYLNKLRPVGYGEKVRTMVDQARRLNTPEWNESQLRQLAVSNLGHSSSQMPIEFPKFDSQPLSFNSTPDGKFVFVGMEGGQVAIYRRDNFEDHHVFPVHQQPVIGIRFPDERTCYTATIYCGEIMKWTFDGAAWQPAGMLENRCPEGATDIRLSHDGRYVIGWTSCSPPAGTMQYVVSETPQTDASFPGKKSVFYVRETDSASRGQVILPVPASAAFDLREHILLAIDRRDENIPRLLIHDLNSETSRSLGLPVNSECVALSPDLTEFVCGDYTRATLHECCGGKQIRTLLNQSAYGAQYVGETSVVSFRGAKNYFIIPTKNPQDAWTLDTLEKSDVAGFSSDGKCLFRFNVATGRAAMLKTIQPDCQVWTDDQRAVDDVSFSADGTVTVCSRTGNHVQLRETATGQLLADIPGVRAALHPSGEWLAVNEWKGIRVLHLPDLEDVSDLPVKEKMYNRMSFTPDGRFLIGYGWDGPNTSVFRFTSESDPPELKFLTDLDSECNSAAWSPNGHRLAWIRHGASPGEHRVMLCDFDAPTLQPVELNATSVLRNYCTITFLTDDRLLFFNEDARLQVWDLQSQQIIRESDDEFSNPLVASPDGKYVMAADKLVATDTLEKILEFPRFASKPWAVDWSRSGDRIAFGHNGGEITVWDLKHVHKALQTLELDFSATKVGDVEFSEALTQLCENPHESAKKASAVVQLDDASRWKESLAGIESRPTVEQLQAEFTELTLETTEQIPDIVERLYAASEWPPFGQERQAARELLRYARTFVIAHDEKRVTLPDFERLLEACLGKFRSLESPSIASQAVTAVVLDTYAKVIVINEARHAEALRYCEACADLLQKVTADGALAKMDFGHEWYWTHIRYATLANQTHDDATAIRMFAEAFRFADTIEFRPRPQLQEQYTRALAQLLARNEQVPERSELLRRYPELLELQPNSAEKESWNLLVIEPAVADFQIVDEQIEVTVTKVGTESFHAQLSMNPSLLEGHTYRLSFEALSPSSSTIGVEVARAVPDYRSIGLFEQLELQPTFQPYTFSFVAKDVAELSRVSFSLGTQIGKMQVRNLKLEEVLPVSDETPN